MSEKWPKAVILQALVLMLTILLGAFLIDGINQHLWPRSFFGHLVTSLPALLLIPWLNRKEDYLCFLSRSKAQEDIPTVLVAGQRVFTKEIGDQEELRFLNTHGDIGRRSRVMISFWAQIAISYFALYFIHPSPTIGAVTVCGAGVAMVLSFGQGHLLIIPAIQALVIMARLKGISTETPFLLFLYGACFISLMCGAFLIDVRESSHRPFEFLFRGTVSALVLALLFLAVDMALPSNEKWWEKLFKLAMPKKIEMATSPKAKEGRSSSNLTALGQLSRMPKLSPDQILTKLDNLEQMMSQMEGMFSGIEVPEFDMMKSDMQNFRSGLEMARLNRDEFDPTWITQLEGKITDLQQSMGRLSNKVKLTKSQSHNSEEFKRLEQFSKQLDSMGRELKFEIPPPGKNKFRLKKMRNEFSAKEGKSNVEPKFISDKNLKRILWVSVALIALAIGRALFKRVKSTEVQSEEELEIINDTRKLYNKERRKWKTCREEVLKSYSIFHNGVEKLDYAPKGKLAPPPAILVQEYRGDRKSLEVIGSIFCDVKYGDFQITRKEIKEFRRSFKKLL